MSTDLSKLNLKIDKLTQSVTKGFLDTKENFNNLSNSLSAASTDIQTLYSKLDSVNQSIQNTRAILKGMDIRLGNFNENLVDIKRSTKLRETADLTELNRFYKLKDNILSKLTNHEKRIDKLETV